jgi:FkbM family methyltransferase
MLYIIRRIVIKIEKKYNITLFYFFPFRLLLVALEFLLLKKNQLTKIANYFLDENFLKNKKINLVSAGIGNDISFEKSLMKSYDINKVILLDPTENSKQFMENYKNFIFENNALFNKNVYKKIYFKNGNENYSLENLFSSKNFTKVKCVTILDLINKYSIHKIHLLKLDVEGVADKIIIDALENDIQIDQFCFELERPLSLFKQFDYFKRYLNLIKKLKDKNFNVYNCTQIKLGLRSEITAVKKYE